MELTFSDCTLPEKARGDTLLAAHMIGKREPDCKRQAAAYNCIAAVEIGGAIEEVHGTTATAAATFLLAIHLGQHRSHRHPAHQRVTVFTIGGNDPVIILEHRDHTYRNRFLPIIQMEKASNFFLCIKLCAFVLEPANPDHLPQQLLNMR